MHVKNYDISTLSKRHYQVNMIWNMSRFDLCRFLLIDNFSAVLGIIAYKARQLTSLPSLSKHIWKNISKNSTTWIHTSMKHYYCRSMQETKKTTKEKES